MRCGLLVLLTFIVCCIMTADCLRKQNAKKKLKPINNKHKRRGILIKCCGFKRCVGNFSTLATNSTKQKVPGTSTTVSSSTQTTKASQTDATSDGELVLETTEVQQIAQSTMESEETSPGATQPSELLSPTDVPLAVETTIQSTEPPSTPSETTTTTSASTTSTTTSTSTSTSTTTFCPSTTPVHCKSHKDAQTLVNSVALKSEKEKLWTRNGSTYFVLSFPSNISHAAAYCLKKGMTLPELQDQSELNTLSQIAQEISGEEMWTSGFVTKATGACDPNVSIFWCPSPFPSVNSWWSSSITRLDNSTIGYYVKASNGSLKLANEMTELRFACKCARPNTCPRSCSSNASLFNPDGTLKENRRGSNWRSFCGKTFYFTSDMGTWEQNFMRCCSLGMRPVWFKDAGEMSCVAREVAASNWSLGLNFWTGGTQQGCWGQWGWCGPSGSDQANTDGLAWASGQPDNANASEGCLHMRVLRNSTGLVLTDRNCSSKYFIACQGTPTFMKPCDSPSCPQFCEKNMTLFHASSDVLKTKAMYGNWIQGCGRDYLFAKANMTWEAAHKFCCSINARLLSVERLDFLDCLTGATDKMPRAKYSWALGKEFWTSGTNINCTGSLGWCSNKMQPVDNREARWRSGHPKLIEGQCVTVTLLNRNATENSSLATASCTDLRQPICERPLRPTDSMQKSFECSETWKLTDDEMKTVLSLSFNVSTAPRRIKCYIKCVGLGHNLFDFGSSQYSPALAVMMESASGGDDAIFQAGAAGLEDCSKRYDDDCTTAAAYYGCNNEKNPALMATMISSTNSSSPPSADPKAGTASGDCVATQWRMCPPEPNCTVDVARKNALLASGSDALGSIVTTRGGRKYYLAKNPVVADQTHSWHTAYCCQLGMRMAVFDTEEDYVDWRDSPRPLVGFAQFGATYDNGDDTDSWCATHQKVPPGITTSTTGKPPYGECGRTDASMILFDNDMKPHIGQYEGLNELFICQWF